MNLKERVSEYSRRMGLGSMQTPSMDDEEENVGGFSLPKDFHAISEKARHMESLVQHPAWKLLLDELELHADAALGLIKTTEHADAITMKGLADRWREKERRIRDLEQIVLDAISARDNMLKDLTGKYGDEAEDILDDAKLAHDVRQHFKSEGMIAVEEADKEDWFQ